MAHWDLVREMENLLNQTKALRSQVIDEHSHMQKTIQKGEVSQQEIWKTSQHAQTFVRDIGQDLRSIPAVQKQTLSSKNLTEVQPGSLIVSQIFSQTDYTAEYFVESLPVVHLPSGECSDLIKNTPNKPIHLYWKESAHQHLKQIQQELTAPPPKEKHLKNKTPLLDPAERKKLYD